MLAFWVVVNSEVVGLAPFVTYYLVIGSFCYILSRNISETSCAGLILFSLNSGYSLFAILTITKILKVR
jgi:hypothetical protein